MKARSQASLRTILAWLVAVRVIDIFNGDWVPWAQLACTFLFGLVVARAWALLVPPLVLAVSCADLLLVGDAARIDGDEIARIAGLAEGAVAAGILSCHGVLRLHVLRSRRRTKGQD